MQTQQKSKVSLINFTYRCLPYICSNHILSLICFYCYCTQSLHIWQHCCLTKDRKGYLTPNQEYRSLIVGLIGTKTTDDAIYCLWKYHWSWYIRCVSTQIKESRRQESSNKGSLTRSKPTNQPTSGNTDWEHGTDQRGGPQGQTGAAETQVQNSREMQHRK